MKFLEPTRKPKVITPTIPWNLASLARNYPGIIVRQRHTDRKLMVECCCYLRNVQDLLSDWKTHYVRRFGIPINGPDILFGAMVEYHFIFCQKPVAVASIWSKSRARKIPRLCTVRGRNLERRHCGRRH